MREGKWQEMNKKAWDKDIVCVRGRMRGKDKHEAKNIPLPCEFSTGSDSVW